MDPRKKKGLKKMSRRRIARKNRSVDLCRETIPQQWTQQRQA